MLDISASRLGEVANHIATPSSVFKWLGIGVLRAATL
jgi:hypothetical protein